MTKEETKGMEGKTKKEHEEVEKETKEKRWKKREGEDGGREESKVGLREVEEMKRMQEGFDEMWERREDKQMCKI